MTASPPQQSLVKDYYELCKPRVVFLMLVTAWVGMLLAVPVEHIHAYVSRMVYGTFGIGLCAFAAAALNHIIDKRFDIHMARTTNRPIARGRISIVHGFCFSACLGTAGFWLLYHFTNPLTAFLTLASLFGYAFLYTVILKHVTPQNIVIGGISGAAPPLLGWTAMTGHIAPLALLLVLLIFVWTPPHFWALAIFRYHDYAKVNIPMLPVTHGIPFTKLSILLYSILLCCIGMLPFALHLTHLIYGISSFVFNTYFLILSIQLYRAADPLPYSKALFRYSIIYLFAIFIALLVDHMWS